MKLPEPLILIGANGFARETAWLIAAINEREPQWDLLGFVDDSAVGDRVDGHPVLGPLEAIHAFPSARLVCAIGSPVTSVNRPELIARLDVDTERFATLIHPAATIPVPRSIGPGSVIHAGTVFTADVSVGAHSRIMPLAVCTHDDVLDGNVTLATGVALAGSVHVGANAYIGAGALVREHLRIGRNAIVGMGAVVTRDVPSGTTRIGNPARPLRTARAGVR